MISNLARVIKVLVVMETKGVVSSAVYSGNTLVVIRFTDDDDPCSVDCFNFLSNSWKKLPSITKAIAFPSAVVVNNFEY
jgi:hypothetical protein